MSFPSLRSGHKCLVTFSNEGVAKEKALLFANNPLKSKKDGYIWIFFEGRSKTCYQVTTIGNSASDLERSNITVFGETSESVKGTYTKATKRDFDKQKLATQSAISGMLLIIGTWISASLGTLNAAKVLDSGWHFDRVSPITWCLVVLSLVLAVCTWLREHLNK